MGAAVGVQGALRAIPGDGQAVAGGLAWAPALPLPSELSLHFTVQKAVENCHHQALEGSNTQLKQELVFRGDANGKHSKHHVVDAEQRDEQQGGLGQPPGPGGH